MTVHKAGEARKRATNSTRSTNSTLRLLASTWNSRYGNHYFEKREMENGSLEARSWQRRSTPLLAFQTGMQACPVPLATRPIIVFRAASGSLRLPKMPAIQNLATPVLCRVAGSGVPDGSVSDVGFITDRCSPRLTRARGLPRNPSTPTQVCST